VSVSAFNLIGEGAATSLSLKAASVPSRMSQAIIDSAGPTNIKVDWIYPSFDGGDTVTSYNL
jgi:hypothetical protein